MGYYTRFELLEYGDVSYEDVVNYLKLGSSYGFSWVLRGEDTVKWYDHVDDMRGLSREYPDTLFVLAGQGENTEDVWVKYFRNGQWYEEKLPRWQPPPFDSTKLSNQASTYI